MLTNGSKKMLFDNDINLKQAGTAIPDEEVMMTMIAFSQGETYNSPNSYTAASRNNNIFQGRTYGNIKQTATIDDFEMVHTMLRFGRAL
jgi:hypothetical protein